MKKIMFKCAGCQELFIDALLTYVEDKGKLCFHCLDDYDRELVADGTKEQDHVKSNEK